jgi:hypothetical protein
LITEVVQKASLDEAGFLLGKPRAQRAMLQRRLRFHEDFVQKHVWNKCDIG